MKSKCTRVLLGCLFASLLALPAMAADQAVRADEEAYSAIKERLFERVERGVASPLAVERFLASLEESSRELMEIREKGDDASLLRVRSLLSESGVELSKSEADGIAESAVRWAEMRQLRETREALTPARRQVRR